MKYTKADYNHMAHLRRRAMKQIADRLGEEHQITVLMGSMSYGRNHAEQGPDGNLQTAIREMAFLDGCFHILSTWARENDRRAQRVMLEIYPHGFATRP